MPASNPTAASARGWMKFTLAAAAVYNLAWGAAAVLLPTTTLGLLGVDAAGAAAPLWQCIGMIIGVFGVGYAVAARDPLRHWPIVLVGLLGKVFGPIGFVQAAVLGDVLPLSMGWTIITNDLVWWVPFAGILFAAAKFHTAPTRSPAATAADSPSALAAARTTTGTTLGELSSQGPLAVVFLRHLGCTFCRETASDIAAKRDTIASKGLGLAFVHPSEDNDAASSFFTRYGLADVPRVADPTGGLYDSVRLDRGSFAQLFGPKVWLRGFVAGVLKRHTVGSLQGDGFRMPGVALMKNGTVVSVERHAHAAERSAECVLALGDDAASRAAPATA